MLFLGLAMTLELINYFLLMCLSICFINIRFVGCGSYCFLFLFFLIYFSTVRYSGWDTDFYYSYVPNLSDGLLGGYIYQPFIWLGTRSIYYIVGSPEITFLIFDMLLVLSMLYSQKKSQKPLYYVLLFLLFFPSVLGVNNVYRQFAASCFFFSAYMLIDSRQTKKSFFFLILAILSHTAIITLAPVLLFKYLFNKNSRFVIPIFVLSVFSLMLISRYYSYGSYEYNTGTVSYIGYIFVFCFFVFFVFFVKALTSLDMSLKYFIKDFTGVFYVVFLTLVFIFVSNSVGIKRISLLSMMVVLIFYFDFLEGRVKQKNIILSFLAFAFSMLSFFTPATFSMLTTAMIK